VVERGLSLEKKEGEGGRKVIETVKLKRSKVQGGFRGEEKRLDERVKDRVKEGERGKGARGKKISLSIELGPMMRSRYRKRAVKGRVASLARPEAS